MAGTNTRGRVVVLAGGLGKRLAPYTAVLPKPLMPIGTLPILEIVLRQLSCFGFQDVTLALGHMAELVMAVAGDGSRFGVRLTYSIEPTPLGTIGPLHLIDCLTDDFIVMNADLLTDLPFDDLWEDHRKHGHVATVATLVKRTKLELGVIDTDASNRIVGFHEKPVVEHRVSTGIYVFNKAVLAHVPRDTFFGFDMLMHALLSRNEPVRSYPFHGNWLDIGIPADYERAQEEFERHHDWYFRSPTPVLV